jgi:hypothetical protein
MKNNIKDLIWRIIVSTYWGGTKHLFRKNISSPPSSPPLKKENN